MKTSIKIAIFIVLFICVLCIGYGAFLEINKINYNPPLFASLVDTAKNKEPEPRPDPAPTLKETIAKKIEQGKDFLYKMEDPDLYGFHKYYYAEKDSLENRLHTVYSASIIYTFLYIYDYNKDEKILAHLDEWGGFLLSMQETNKESQRYGAFSYSYFLDSEEKEKRYVSGTSALSIFTLLRLYEVTGKEKYLESAKIAGDWLISMQKENGVIKPYTRYNGEEWISGIKLSLLYNGQSLSALSKLYKITKEKKYYNSAKKIADLFTLKYEEAGRSYVVGEYRAKNPISNTWIVISLMDFYKAAGEGYYKDIVFELSSQIISNQFKDPEDLMNYGRIDGAYSTSGNGWISEVMTDTYSFCLDQGKSDCEKYKETALNIMRWLIDRTYVEENSSSLPNPEKAEGGVFWNKEFKYVRTDSVCHALNGYTRIMKYLEEGATLSI